MIAHSCGLRLWDPAGGQEEGPGFDAGPTVEEVVGTVHVGHVLLRGNEPLLDHEPFYSGIVHLQRIRLGVLWVLARCSA